VLPKSVEQVAAVLRECNLRRIPVTPRGAGTGIEGGAIPYHGGVVITTEQLKGIEVRVADMNAKVGAGVKKLELNKALFSMGLLFGPDPSSNPCIGGMCSTGGSGMSTPKYGTTKENVLALTVVTPEGRIIQTRRAVRKSSTGYDLTQLYMGSEGTLGVICEVVVRVNPIPRVRSGAVIRFESVREAALSVIAIMSANITTLARCELLNKDAVFATNKVFDTVLPVVPTLILEFQADNHEHTGRDYESACKASRRHGATSCDYCETGQDLDDIWEARRGCYPAAAKYRGGMDKVLLSDVCVPLSQLADCISETEADFNANNLPCIICAHIADGNFHCCIPYKPNELVKIHALEARMIERGLAMGGTVSGEHGVGIGKMEHIINEHGTDYIDLMRRIKKALDPNSIMNPDKIFSLDAMPSKL